MNRWGLRRVLLLALALLLLTPSEARAANDTSLAREVETLVAANQSAVASEANVAYAVTSQPVANDQKLPPDSSDSNGDGWGWLKVVVGGLLGAATVLATQWITARTNRQIAKEHAEISRAAVGVASEAAKASGLSASAAIESASAAWENAKVAARSADNLGIHSVARLRQEWINTVRDELSKLHTLLTNHRQPPSNETEAEGTLRNQRQRDANQSKAKLALLLNPREIPTRNLTKAIARLEDATLSTADRSRKARWIIRWGQILLKDEWDRVRAELKGTLWVEPRRRASRGPVGKHGPISPDTTLLAD